MGLCCLAPVKVGAMNDQGLDMDFLAGLFVQAEETTGLPRNLIAAIAAQESSFWPWSVNLAGKGYYADSKESALANIGTTRNYDLGLMQINSEWLPRFGISAEDAIDPVMNVTLGALILLDCVERHGMWGGIACYHAGSPKRAHGQSYAEKVVSRWRVLEDSVPDPGAEVAE